MNVSYISFYTSEFSRILIPIHRQLVPNHLLPNATSEQIAHHWPFAEQPDRLVCLTHIEDSVEILGSQTRPKKMTWVGSDGREYIIVAKPNVSSFSLLYPKITQRYIALVIYQTIMKLSFSSLCEV